MIISIAEDFSVAPAGRNASDGPKSGEAFREELLAPNLRGTEEVIVQLDGVEGYGSSFLEEAFGGLVRVDDFGLQELDQRLKLVSEDIALVQEIQSYMHDASKAKAEV